MNDQKLAALGALRMEIKRTIAKEAARGVLSGEEVFGALVGATASLVSDVQDEEVRRAFVRTIVSNFPIMVSFEESRDEKLLDIVKSGSKRH